MVQLLTMVGGATAVFAVAYVVYGRSLARYFDLDADRTTPAHEHADGHDYVPSRKAVLVGHHFSSIAGGAPIVGPITAALAWGWAPALAWIVVGTVVFGGLNDLGTLTSSVRHDGRSIGHVFGEYVTPRGKTLLLSLGVVANLLVVGVLSLVAAVVFDSYPSAATASVVYVALAFAFGAYRRRTDLPFLLGALVFGAGVFAGVGVGLHYPLVLVPDGATTLLPTVVNQNVSAWLAVLLAYAFAASVLPVSTLLQPRDFLSSLLLYAGLGGAVLAVVVGSLLGTAVEPLAVTLDPFTGFMSDEFGGMGPLVPMLFPTIFCGAVCGLHSMVCCGTTPKQLDSEGDALAVGYGTTLAEGVLAVVAIATVAVLPTVPTGSGISLALPSFARGGAILLTALGLPRNVGAPFMALVLSAFALTTADTAIRLGRYFLEDLVGDPDTAVERVAVNRYLNAGAQSVAAYLLVASGTWATVWPLFGASVQVFAGVSILTVAVWMTNRDHAKTVAGLLAGSGFVLAVSVAALLYLGARNVRRLLDPAWVAGATPTQLASVVMQVAVALLLVALAAELVRLAYRHVAGRASDERGVGQAGD